MTERRPPWRKSTYSNGSSSCIETANIGLGPRVFGSALWTTFEDGHA